MVPWVNGTGALESTGTGMVEPVARFAMLHWPSLGSCGVPNNAVCNIGVDPVAKPTPIAVTATANCALPGAGAVPGRGRTFATQLVVPVNRPNCSMTAITSSAVRTAASSFTYPSIDVQTTVGTDVLPSAAILRAEVKATSASNVHFVQVVIFVDPVMGTGEPEN